MNPMNEPPKQPIVRFAIIFTLVSLGFGAVLAKICYTQWVESDQLLPLVMKQVKNVEQLNSARGSIYDCEGRLLAGSAPLYSIFMDTRTQALRANNGELFSHYVDSVAYALSSYFGDRTPAEYSRHLREGYDHKEGRLRLYPKQVTYSQLKALKQMPLFNKGIYKSGFFAEPRYQRIRPFGSLAARSIGSIYGQTGKGVSGLEKGYEDVLHGTNGKRVTQLAEGYVVSSVETEPVDGLDLLTTIDANMQDVAETQLRLTLERLQADWGTCILMETKTGKIRAIANLGRTSEGGYIEDRNYAVMRIEPGSTFKTYSLMAALDDGKVSLEDTIDVTGGIWYYEKAKRPIRDSHILKDKQGNPINYITIKQALAASSNVGLAKIVTSAYDKKAERFVDKLGRMGVRDSVPFDIPGTQQPRINAPSDEETLARMAFGYYVELPPIDILMFYNAIANGGRMVRPYLVEEVLDNGRTVKRFSPQTVTSSVCHHSTLRDIQECLEAVVWDNEFGTASVSPWGRRKAQSDIVHIAGKTGTAQVFADGIYRNYQHRTLFCGYFPMEEPRYSCICVIQQRPYGQYDAGYDCGGTVRRIAEKVMAYSGTTHVSTYALSSDSVPAPHVKRGMEREIRMVSKKLRIPVRQWTDSLWISMDRSYEVKPFSLSSGLVPDVRGMGARDAVFLLEQTGMLATIRGKGHVVSQSVPAGTKIVEGTHVILELR